MNAIINERLQAFRREMSQNNIDIFIVPSSDPHLSEYVADTFKGRAYITGFTGSAGTAVISATEAGLFTDGRYFIQAESQLEGTGFSLIKMATPGHPTLEQWLGKRLKDGMTLGYDGRLFSAAQIKKIKAALTDHDIRYRSDLDIIDRIWSDRPAMPIDPVFIHDHHYTGADVREKLDRIRLIMDSNHRAGTYLMNSLCDIAWLFNLRGSDIDNTPIAYAYALITDMSATVYIDSRKLPNEAALALHNEGVSVKEYNEYYEDLKTVRNQTVIYDPDKANALMIDSLDKSNHLLEAIDLTYMEKACFTDYELKNMRNAHIKDGVAMIRFLHWLDTNIDKGITEHDAKDQVAFFRSQQEGFIEPSFETIPAYAGNAAMMHYSTPAENSPVIQPKGLFLVDSGGQYYDGTTDITRTIAVGPLTDEEKKDFTLVLKGHLALDKMIFLSGITGTNLDTIARQPIWAERMDYKSGTGHGIGYLLSVHDGPARIRMQHNDVVLKPGMVLTNEPGIYKQDKHGIRTENVIVVQELETNTDGMFLNFETISFCPIDKRAINIEMLSPSEIEWVNDYHKTVFEKLSPYVEGDVLAWLEDATSEL